VGETLGQLRGATSALGAAPDTLYDTVPYPGAPTGDSLLYLKERVFLQSFAPELPTQTAQALWASQSPAAMSAFTTPSAAAAWRTIPSWYVIGAADKIITPESQLMMARRARAHPAGPGWLTPHPHLAPHRGHQPDPGRRPDGVLGQLTSRQPLPEVNEHARGRADQIGMPGLVGRNCIGHNAMSVDAYVHMPGCPWTSARKRRGMEGWRDDTVLDEEERNARLEAYARQARDSVCRIAEDGRTEVGLEVEHDGRWFRTIDHIPGEDVSDDAIEPIVARRAQQIARQMLARDEARRQSKPGGR
jgi:hypothetical protein